MTKLCELELPAPGIYGDVTFEEYKRWPADNVSRLKLLGRSPAHFQANEESPREASEAMRMGSLFHTAILEGPDCVMERYAVEPKFDDILTADGRPATNPRATKAYKVRRQQWVDSIGAKEPIDLSWFESATLANRNAMNHELLRAALLSETKLIEQSALLKANDGTFLKCRFDLIDPARGWIVDLKTMSRPLTDIPRRIAEFSYHIQASFYRGVARNLLNQDFQFVFAFVETSPPFSVVAAPLSEPAMDVGWQSVKRYLKTLKECRERNHWPGPSSPKHFDLPSWYYEKVTA